LGGPTWQTHCDAHGERALAKALLRAKEKQITVVTITQRAALLQSVDKIMILHQGAVQAFGSRDEIIPVITGSKPTNIPGGPGGPPPLN
jgi:ATP-binding cassette subfamily C protein